MIDSFLETPDSSQNRVSADQYHLTVSLRCGSIEVTKVFFEVTR